MHRPLGRTPPPSEPAEVLRQVKRELRDVASDLRSGTRRATKQAKRQVNEVVRAIVDTVHEEAERLFDAQRDLAASKVERVGKMVHQASHALHAVRMDGVADYIDSAAEQVESLSDYIKERNLNDILQDAGEIVSRNKGLAIGGLFLTGFAVARFLKASEAQAGVDDEEESDEDDGGGRERPSRRNGTRDRGARRRR